MVDLLVKSSVKIVGGFFFNLCSLNASRRYLMIVEPVIHGGPGCRNPLEPLMNVSMRIQITLHEGIVAGMCSGSEF